MPNFIKRFTDQLSQHNKGSEINISSASTDLPISCAGAHSPIKTSIKHPIRIFAKECAPFCVRVAAIEF